MQLFPTVSIALPQAAHCDPICLHAVGTNENWQCETFRTHSYAVAQRRDTVSPLVDNIIQTYAPLLAHHFQGSVEPIKLGVAIQATQSEGKRLSICPDRINSAK